MKSYLKLIALPIVLLLGRSAQAQTESVVYTPYALSVSGIGTQSTYTPAADSLADSVWTYLKSYGTVAGSQIYSARKIGTSGTIATYEKGRTSLWPWQVASVFTGATTSGSRVLLEPVVSVTNDSAATIAIPTAKRLTYLITYNGGAGAYSIAAPTTGTDDGKEIWIVTLGAQAHVVTCASEGFNAKGSTGTVTFTAAIGNAVLLMAYHGHWYTVVKTGVTPA